MQNIPQPSDRLKDSQPQLLANFQAIDTLVNVNHVDFDDPSGDQGKHKWSAYPGPNPSYAPPVVPGEVTVFNSLGTTTLVNELTIIKSDGEEVFATESNLSYGLPATSGGWSRLPSGILMTWTTTSGMVTPGATRTIVPINELDFSQPPFVRLWKVYLTPRLPALGATAATVTFGQIVDPTNWNLGFTCRVYGTACFVDIIKVGY